MNRVQYGDLNILMLGYNVHVKGYGKTTKKRRIKEKQIFTW